MRRVLGLAIIGIFFISLGLTGCGYVKKDEFLPEYQQFKAENAQEHEQISGNVEQLDKKVDEQKDSLKESIDEAKNEAIAASEQGDADTIATAKDFAKEQDTALRAEVEDAIEKAKDDAKDYSESGDENLRAEISKLNRNIQSDLSQIDSQLSQGARMIQEVKDMAKKAMADKVVTVHFASGKSGLSDDAKAKLDDAVPMIKGKGTDWMLKVVGHADARSVLSGKYRSNLDLSYARANIVKDYLVEKGITHKIKVTARGHSEPVASPDSVKGQKENRRVEVILVASE
jgi:chemotaxis protein MotB